MFIIHQFETVILCVVALSNLEFKSFTVAMSNRS